MKKVPYCETVEDFEALLQWNINLEKIVTQDECTRSLKISSFNGRGHSAYSQTEIAEKISVHKSTISREFKRNIFWWISRIPQYKLQYAQTYAKSATNKNLRKLNSRKKSKHL